MTNLMFPSIVLFNQEFINIRQFESVEGNDRNFIHLEVKDNDNNREAITRLLMDSNKYDEARIFGTVYTFMLKQKEYIIVLSE